MSRKGRSKRQQYRAAGVAAPVSVSQRIVDVAASFEAQLQTAAMANAIQARVPYGHVQTIVPGANYGGKANTAEAYARLQKMKQGVDPALNKRFETAAEAREYRKREGVDVMSPKEYEAETRNMRSSRRFNAFVDSDHGGCDPNTGRVVQGFNPNAFTAGERALAAMEQQAGFRMG